MSDKQESPGPRPPDGPKKLPRFVVAILWVIAALLIVFGICVVVVLGSL